MLLLAFITGPARTTLLRLVLFSFLAPCIWPRSVNRTIDDTYGDSVTGLLPIYTNLGGGAQGWHDSYTCDTSAKACVAPDKSQTFNQTYKYLVTATVTLQFTGTAIYFFTLKLNGTAAGISIPEEIFKISLDGVQVAYDDLGLDVPAYNVLMYSATNLKNGTHNLTASPDQFQPLFFDYAIYTHEDSEPDGEPTASSTPRSSASGTAPPSVALKRKNLAGPIAGGVVGGLIVVLGALGFFFYRARRRRQSTKGVVFAGGALEDNEKTAPAPAVEWTPAELFTTLPSGETQLSPLAQVIPPEALAAEEKQALRKARQEEAARQVGLIEQEIRALAEEAEARGLPATSASSAEKQGLHSARQEEVAQQVGATAEEPPPAVSTAASSTGQADPTNVQLLEEIRMLRNQMNAIQQQQLEMQATISPGLPQYTPGPT